MEKVEERYEKSPLTEIYNMDGFLDRCGKEI